MLQIDERTNTGSINNDYRALPRQHRVGLSCAQTQTLSSQSMGKIMLGDVTNEILYQQHYEQSKYFLLQNNTVLCNPQMIYGLSGGIPDGAVCLSQGSRCDLAGHLDQMDSRGYLDILLILPSLGI